jgi:hypothetical protein
VHALIIGSGQNPSRSARARIPKFLACERLNQAATRAREVIRVQAMVPIRRTFPLLCDPWCVPASPTSPFNLLAYGGADPSRGCTHFPVAETACTDALWEEKMKKR